VGQYVKTYAMLCTQDLLKKKKSDEAVAVLPRCHPNANWSNIYAVLSYDVI
jgi:hypothetical protein